MKLWLPEYAHDYLSVTVNPNESGDREWENMKLINHSGYLWVNGELDGETYFDTLEYAGLDPIEFVEPVFEYLKDFR